MYAANCSLAVTEIAHQCIQYGGAQEMHQIGTRGASSRRVTNDITRDDVVQSLGR